MIVNYLEDIENRQNSVVSVGSLSVSDFRESINEFRNNLSVPIVNEQIEANNERRWRLSCLKQQFESLQLHNLFNRYTERINHGYFSQFSSLQIILSLSHLTVVLISNKSNTSPVLPDLVLYGTVCVFSVIILFLTDSYVKKHPRLLRIFAIFAFTILFFTNVFVPVYHSKTAPFGHFRPAYTTHLIISCYVFLNVRDNLLAIILGLFISVFHIAILVLATYGDSSMLWQRIVSDVIFLICINGLGVYFRYMNEIVKRRSFLDRRACVESTFQLKFEKEQEDQLMSSIIPKHIIDEVRSDIMRFWDHIQKLKEVPQHRPFENPYVEIHENVSILFADIVNYTEMTSKLNINDLLETLNELFGRFDDASEELKVLRIKFLGDCYYCVSGLPPDPAPNHAEACVDLGLKMISIIQDVRSHRNLNINMRIGVHTGRIISGIIGSIKWQYDIWSNDVDIANKMETEGQAGKVHITAQTKQLLRKSYDISHTNKGETVPSFKQNNIETFLISPTLELSASSETNECRSHSIVSELEFRKDPIYFRRPVMNGRRISGNPARIRSVNSMASERRVTSGEVKRRTAFMNNNIKRYEERLKETNRELEMTIENMLLSKYEQWFKVNEMNPFSLMFKNMKSELHFIKMPDPLFKYYLLSEILLIILVFIIENLTIPKWDWSSWSFYATIGTILLLFLPLTWTHYLWTRHVSKYESDAPKNCLVRFFYNKSKFVTNNIFARLLIYTIVCMLFVVCVLTELIECRGVNFEDKAVKKQNLLSLVMDLRTSDGNIRSHCSIPWHMTETCSLAIIMSFIFLRMYMWIKFLYATVITIIYAYCVSHFNDEFYNDNETFNYLVKPQVSHILSVIFLTISLHLIDRQTEYMNRLDHLWYETLIDEQGKANNVHFLNNMLLKNILPTHVAELYLDVNRQNRSSSGDLYHEQYNGAAVMFASIVNYSTEDLGRNFLTVMNRIICDFDTLLVGNTFGRPIEKIKIAKWTYMAACGLVPGLGNAENIKRDQTTHAVISLTKFAASLMRKLHQINDTEMFLKDSDHKFQLRVGIGYGPIVAGVVGSKKPLYDIWGDSVNMASRMDTTGLPNKIQVLGETAEIIQQFGFKCDYRGEIAVKGKERLMSTYFVGLDENFDLIKGEKGAIVCLM